MNLMLLMACSGTHATQHDPQRYREALELLLSDPEAAVQMCHNVQREPLRSDCFAATAESVAAQDPEAAAQTCTRIADPLLADECWFMLAEHTQQLHACEQAGRFRDDCVFHLLQQSLAQVPLHGPDDPAVQQFVQQAPMSDDDPRLLTLVFRQALSTQQPLNLAPCSRSISPLWCLRAGQGLFHDRLNRARDQGVITEAWCGGERQSIPTLQHVPHPSLDDVIQQRNDLCS